jgi:tRNA-binding protein
MHMQGQANEIAFDDFRKVEIRAGTITGARLNPKARNPAYILDIDFGDMVGTKASSAQITEAYDADGLVGQQIIAVMNFAPKRVAGVQSEVLVLAIVQDDGPTTLVTPTWPVQNGARLA